MVETFPADRPDQARRIAVLPGTDVVMSDNRECRGNESAEGTGTYL